MRLFDPLTTHPFLRAFEAFFFLGVHVGGSLVRPGRVS